LRVQVARLALFCHTLPSLFIHPNELSKFSLHPRLATSRPSPNCSGRVDADRANTSTRQRHRHHANSGTGHRRVLGADARGACMCNAQATRVVAAACVAIGCHPPATRAHQQREKCVVLKIRSRSAALHSHRRMCVNTKPREAIGAMQPGKFGCVELARPRPLLRRAHAA
jgi:hypothetical protein